MHENTVQSLIILSGVERGSRPVCHLLRCLSIFRVGQPIHRSQRSKRDARSLCTWHFIYCNVCIQEQRCKDTRNRIPERNAGFQAHRLLRLQSFMWRRNTSLLLCWRRGEVVSLFIYQRVGRIYVITLDDRFSVSCQMFIEFVIQLLPVDSVPTNVSPCLFIETIIIAGF